MKKISVILALSLMCAPAFAQKIDDSTKKKRVEPTERSVKSLDLGRRIDVQAKSAPETVEMLVLNLYSESPLKVTGIEGLEESVAPASPSRMMTVPFGPMKLNLQAGDDSTTVQFATQRVPEQWLVVYEDGEGEMAYKVLSVPEKPALEAGQGSLRFINFMPGDTVSAEFGDLKMAAAPMASSRYYSMQGGTQAFSGSTEEKADFIESTDLTLQEGYHYNIVIWPASDLDSPPNALILPEKAVKEAAE